MNNSRFKSYTFSIVVTFSFCFLLFFILKNNYPVYHKPYSLDEAINSKNESKLKEKIKENIEWMSIINERSRKNKIDVNEILKRDCQFIFDYGLQEYWIDYYMFRIKNDSIWYTDIKNSAQEKSISVDSNLVRAARYMASQKASN